MCGDGVRWTTGELAGEEVRVSDTMEAQLAGVGFRIEAITPTVQLVPGEGATQWKWAIAATKSGEQRLHLTLSAVLTQEGRDRQYTIRTFARTLVVDVTLRERLGGFVDDYAVDRSLRNDLGLLGWLARRRRQRGAEPRPRPSGPG